VTTLPLRDGLAVARALAGDADAFTLVVRRHQNPLYRYGRGLGLDHDTALDLVQETFIKAYARRAQCRETDAFRPWLFRIFRNTVLDWAKNVRRSEISTLDLDETADEVDLAERHALREALGRALAALPPILREAFLLRHALDHPYEEIAEITGISLSAAKMRVARAREALRALLHPDYGDVTGGASRSS
jgi:RNA polymerase sigma factor (sigma-70 family)